MFKDSVTGLECDISLHNPLAVKNTQLLMSYSTVDPRVRQLAYAVKRWSKARDLNNPSSGTSSSYGWMIMLIHFLQVRVCGAGGQAGGRKERGNEGCDMHTERIDEALRMTRRFFSLVGSSNTTTVSGAW